MKYIHKAYRKKRKWKCEVLRRPTGKMKSAFSESCVYRQKLPNWFSEKHISNWLVHKSPPEDCHKDPFSPWPYDYIQRVLHGSMAAALTPNPYLFHPRGSQRNRSPSSLLSPCRPCSLVCCLPCCRGVPLGRTYSVTGWVDKQNWGMQAQVHFYHRHNYILEEKKCYW